MDRALRIGLAGAGHFGRFHARKIVAGPRTVLSGIHDRTPAQAAALAAETGAPACTWEALLAGSDAIVVATPADTHFTLAAAALRAGRHVLVEKPMAATLDEADALATLAGQVGRVLQVGHLLRHSAEYAAIAARIDRPLYLECVRIAPYKPRGTDVSVILDLMIHDLDLVLALVGSDIDSVDAVGAAVAGPHEDIANARIRFSNGCIAQVTASRVSLRTERRMRIFSRAGYLNVDFVGRRLTAVGQKGAPIPGIDARVEEATWEDQDALAAEHAAFAAAVLDGVPVSVGPAAGRAALAAALAVGEAMRVSRARAVASGLLEAADAALLAGRNGA